MEGIKIQINEMSLCVQRATTGHVFLEYKVTGREITKTEVGELGTGQRINTLCTSIRASGFILGDKFS